MKLLPERTDPHRSSDEGADPGLGGRKQLIERYDSATMTLGEGALVAVLAERLFRSGQRRRRCRRNGLARPAGKRFVEDNANDG